LQGKPTDSKEDEVLTAKEISSLELSNVDLLVLSACQTGLGDIQDDGVYGLQRGFKKAGVNTILMSLWKVDDDATQMLMSEFYRNYASGLTKQQSLRQAQKAVRDFHGKINGNMRDFSNPRYWAAFVLLDASN
jgi:CHAT domain-containing protein